MAIGSFSAGLSGLSANSVYLNVIGNNLANINTIGFKSSAVTFEDVVSAAVGGSSNDLRHGGRVDRSGLQSGIHREYARGDQRRHPGTGLLRREFTGRSHGVYPRGEF